MPTHAIDESREFHKWLKKNDNHLRSYTVREKAQLAMAAGFKLDVVCPGICDRLAYIQRLMRFWESDLAAKWLRLCEYQSGKEIA